MDARVTLSFDESVVNKAKRYADKNNISLSRLVESLLKKATRVLMHPPKTCPFQIE